MDINNVSQLVRQRLTKLMKDQSLSLNELCKKSEVPYSTANSFMICKSKILLWILFSNYAVGLNIINRNPFKINGLILRPKSNKETKEVSAFTITLTTDENFNVIVGKLHLFFS